jgi:hypothetical protein
MKEKPGQPGNGWRRSVRGLSILVGMGAGAVRDIRAEISRTGPNLILDHDPLLVRDDKTAPTVEVELAADAQQWLSPPGDPAAAPDSSEIFVLLAADTADPGRVEVQVGGGQQLPGPGRPVGVLSAGGSAAFLPVLEAGRQRGQAVVGTAIRDRAADGSWRLRVYRPEHGPVA